MKDEYWAKCSPEKKAEILKRDRERRRAKAAAKNAIPRPCACGCGLMFVRTHKQKYAPDCKRNEIPERKAEINRMHKEARQRRLANQPPKPKKPTGRPRIQKPATERPKPAQHWTGKVSEGLLKTRYTVSAYGTRPDKLLPGVARVILKAYESTTDPYERARLRATNRDLFGDAE